MHIHTLKCTILETNFKINLVKNIHNLICRKFGENIQFEISMSFVNILFSLFSI